MKNHSWRGFSKPRWYNNSETLHGFACSIVESLTELFNFALVVGMAVLFHTEDRSTGGKQINELGFEVMVQAGLNMAKSIRGKPCIYWGRNFKREGWRTSKDESQRPRPKAKGH